ncbi:MAG: MarR family transcriptional regulator [Methanoregula sp.]
MSEDIKDKVADNFITLVPLFHKQVFRVSQNIGGIKSAQYRVLGILMKEGPLSMSEIGRRLYISKPYMTALVDTLIKNHWVERKQDTEDRRVIRITITPSGKKHLRESLELYKNDLKILLLDLKQEELEQLALSLEHLQAILVKIG